MRIQRWIRRKFSFRRAARDQLTHLLSEGTIEQIQNVMRIAKAAGVSVELLDLAAQVVRDLTAG
eukprot:CAMPEP_0181247464 /NCGR_PEP_ID=MMETSP1096-20121128/44622_1 /TAXON_ID=156174 ORGANISM="Chrysochromulina ericina, Strain CCMP281" /NCGR_SAMPLE_ID=MMETSP1096 /ASSEMBLY_ACC=CAM_ASM_000453 /LENGTH=63 /DNA_ID=CAMNT_0023344511 /DNA_START=9 /DNA_END=196 /DNA_ORIENTATION=+